MCIQDLDVGNLKERVHLEDLGVVVRTILSNHVQLNTTDNDKTTRILTKLQHKYTCLPEKPYTALYS